jgi:hypothetical protein
VISDDLRHFNNKLEIIRSSVVEKFSSGYEIGKQNIKRGVVSSAFCFR